MKSVVLSVVGISSVLLVVMIHTTRNEETFHRDGLRSALAVSMDQTMKEVMERDSYGIGDRNELIAAFLQALLQRADPETSLSVSIHELDREKGVMEVEAISQYTLPDQQKKTVSVRRKIIFAAGNRGEKRE